MNKPKSRLLALAKILNVFTIICSMLILFSLSYDILYGWDMNTIPSFLHLQLFVCIIFMLDLVVRFFLSDNKWRFMSFNWIIFLISIPVLNLIMWTGIQLSPGWMMLIKSAPLIRGFYALVLIVRWFSRQRARDLAIGYLFALISFVYLSALVFYSVEKGVNHDVTNFGNSLWWAFMNVTTVGANVFAVTTIGKILSVMLPFLGMVMLPLFTAYAMEFFKDHSKK